MSGHEPSKIEKLLDLLLDALQERQAARSDSKPVWTDQQAYPVTTPPIAEATDDISSPEEIIEQETVESEDIEPEADQLIKEEEESQDESEEADTPEKLPSVHLDRMLSQFLVALFLLIIVINIPFNRYGTNLARAMPDKKSLVIRDGLLLKGEGDEVYVLEDNQKRWISSIEAFEYYGHHWEHVNIVDDDFLDQFPDGPALSILYKCNDSPHIYAIENGVKRWIKDIPTFEAQGYVWDDVQFVSCAAIEEVPSGPPIPPDAGEPPTP